MNKNNGVKIYDVKKWGKPYPGKVFKADEDGNIIGVISRRKDVDIKKNRS